jgi:benzoylformate decarboxylase
MTDTTDTYTGADLFVDALETYGVSHVFGNPGTTELPIMEALGGSDLEYVLGLHEDIAVGAAAGYAQTRRYHGHHDPEVLPAGVVNLHVTPGVAHGLGNLYDASMAGAPIVVTAGNHSTDFRHEEPILSGDLEAVTEQFCKSSAEVLDVAALPTMLRRAFRVALTPPTGPVFLSLPLDVTMASTDARPERLGSIPTAGRGDPAEIERAADLVSEAKEPVLIVGDGVARSGSGAIEAATDLAEVAGLRVHGEILACEVNFPTAHDQWVSYLPTREDLVASLLDTDLVVFVGCSTNTTLTRHEDPLVGPETTCVHIGADAREIGKNQVADAAILGDPGSIMTAIADRVESRLDSEVRDRRAEGARAMKAAVAERTAASDDGDSSNGGDSDGSAGSEDEGDPRASKAQFVDAIAAAAPDALVVDEGVTTKYAALTRWDLDPETYISNKGGGLGYGLPAAVGAALAGREAGVDRPTIALVGDGSYLYYPHTLYTAARYGVDLTVAIPDNRNYRILKDNSLQLFGGEESEYDFVGMDFDPPVDIPANAESHGATGRLVEDPEDIESALEDAIDTNGPVVLDVLVHD